MKVHFLAAAMAALTVSACAEHPNRVPAAYIPSIIYHGATCEQLAQEHKHLTEHVEHFAQTQLRASNTDTTAVTASILLGFSPILLTLPMTSDQSAHLAVARGHYNALIKAAKSMNCPMQYTVADKHPTEWKHDIAGFPPL